MVLEIISPEKIIFTGEVLSVAVPGVDGEFEMLNNHAAIVSNLKKEKKIKISKFGTFSIREKKPRIGRNPKTKETKMISSREVVLFKPSKEFKEFINLKDNG